jgi:hypothetical protein
MSARDRAAGEGLRGPQQSSLNRWLGRTTDEEALLEEAAVARSERVLEALQTLAEEWPPVPVADGVLSALVLNTAAWWADRQRELTCVRVCYTLRAGNG